MTHAPIQRLAAAVLIALALLLASQSAPAEAQTPTPVSWAFVPRGPLMDMRVTMAFSAAIDTATVASTWTEADVVLAYDGSDGASTPAEDIELLLQAAGLMAREGGPLMLTVARQCAVWVPSGGDDEAMLTAIATGLGADFARVLRGFGVPVEACALTTDAGTADLLVWAGEAQRPTEILGTPDAPANPREDGFLAYPVLISPPGTPGIGGEGPAPAATGIGVTEGEERTSMVVGVLLALLVAGTLAIRIAVRPA